MLLKLKQKLNFYLVLWNVAVKENYKWRYMEGTRYVFSKWKKGWLQKMVNLPTQNRQLTDPQHLHFSHSLSFTFAL
jgi:hypothetical protein